MAIYFDTPQDLGRTLDNGFAIYRASVKPLMALSFLTATVINLPSVINYGITGTTGGGIGGVLMIVAFLIYLPGYVGMIVSQDAIARGDAAPSLGEAYSIGFGKLGSTVGMAILYGLAIVVGLILLVIPGIILSISLCLAFYLVALENKGAVDSLKSSHALVKGYWWRTATVYTVGMLLYFVPTALLSGIAGFVVAMTSSASGVETVEEKVAGFTIVLAVVQIVTAGLLMPLLSGFLLAQYHDLKLRKSGADLLARAPA
jgi:hypothetical protein